jgi:HEAT repeat protein
LKREERNIKNSYLHKRLSPFAIVNIRTKKIPKSFFLSIASLFLLLFSGGCSYLVPQPVEHYHPEKVKEKEYVGPPVEIKPREVVVEPEKKAKPPSVIPPPPVVRTYPFKEDRPEEDPVEILIQNLGSKNMDVRRRAVWALGETGDLRAVEPLMLAFKSENRSIQLNAIDAMGRLGSVGVEYLIEGMNSDDRIIRVSSAKALRKIRDPEAVEHLVEALEDYSAYIRLNAAKALGGTKDPLAVEPLIKALQDGNVYVRKNAAWALGKIKDPVAIEPLAVILQDKNIAVRTSVVRALLAIQDPRVIEPLITALHDEDEKVRKIAGEALEEVTGEGFGEDIELWQEWWEQNRESLIIEESISPVPY